MEDLRDDELMPTIDDRAELETEAIGQAADEPRGEADINVEEETNL